MPAYTFAASHAYLGDIQTDGRGPGASVEELLEEGALDRAAGLVVIVVATVPVTAVPVAILVVPIEKMMM